MMEGDRWVSERERPTITWRTTELRLAIWIGLGLTSGLKGKGLVGELVRVYI